MAAAGIQASPRETQRVDWILANPWPYALFGWLAGLLALAVTRFLGPDYQTLRGTFFLLGLLGAGAGVTLRLNTSQPPFLDNLGPSVRPRLLAVLGGLYGLIGVGLTLALLLSYFEVRWVPWRWGSLLVAWVVIAPICLYACRACLKARQPETFLPWGHEAACLLILAGLTVTACCFALYFGPERREEWMTIRLFLSVAAFVAFSAAPFFLVSQGMRRLGLSLLFLLHFGGIGTAALASPPSPWIISQLWARIYRPYLEFMYLNNAYRFYAPEPDAAAYLWFRLIYEDDQGNPQGVWFKVPDMDEKGNHGHTVALEYQRYLALTTNLTFGLVQTFQLTNLYNDPFQEKGDEAIITYTMNPVLKERWRVSEQPLHFKATKEWYARKELKKEAAKDKKDILGRPDWDKGKREAEKEEPYVPPFINYQDHPNLVPLYLPPVYPPLTANEHYLLPQESAQQLLYSFVRQVSKRPHPDHPEWPLRGVKVYYVKHLIISTDWLASKANLQDPLFYRYYFMGEYEPEGRIIKKWEPSLLFFLPGSYTFYPVVAVVEKNDPLLFFPLPVLRANLNDPKSLTMSFVHRHAGDPKWVSNLNDQGKWDWFVPTRATFEEFRPPKGP